MKVFDFENYKEYVVKVIKTMPKRGYGQYRKIALHLGVNSVVVSQIFKGSRELTAEQALSLSEYLGFTTLERDYFLLLVQLDRAGTHQLKKLLLGKLQELREKSKDLKTRLEQDQQMTEEAKALFYSNWYYSATRLLSSVPGFDSIDAIAERLEIPRSTIKAVVEFLVQHGLCIEREGRLQMGPSRTHLESSSPFLSRNHINWRLKGIENMEPQNPDHLFYSGPMSISLSAGQKIRSELVNLIEGVTKTVVDDPKSPSGLSCLNIDWFQL
ncbi:MAG: TIGR02147 family protein [Bdellovibrionota bacterium]